MSFTILQWNVGNFDVRLRPLGTGPRGLRYTYATPSRDEDLDDLASLIRAENPDIVALQEVVVHSGHHERLAELTGYSLAAAGSPDQRHTQVLLARRGLRFSPGPASQDFNAVSIRIMPDKGHEFIAVSTHSTAGRFTEERVRQHRALAAWVKKLSQKSAVVVAGDFNFDDGPESLHYHLNHLGRRLTFLKNIATSDWEEDRAGLNALRDVMRDLGADAGPTAGAPRLWPRILLPWAAPLIPLAWLTGFGRKRSRLDYIWVSSALTGVETRVLSVTGPRPARPAAAGRPFPWMDHDPVLARIAFSRTHPGC